MGVITISRGCFERCCSNQKTPPYHSNLSFVTLRNRRPMLLRAPAYRTPSEASPRRRCGHAVESTRGISEMASQREFPLWAPFGVGVRYSFTSELRVYPEIIRTPPLVQFWIRRGAVSYASARIVGKGERQASGLEAQGQPVYTYIYAYMHTYTYIYIYIHTYMY